MTTLEAAYGECTQYVSDLPSPDSSDNEEQQPKSRTPSPGREEVAAGRAPDNWRKLHGRTGAVATAATGDLQGHSGVDDSRADGEAPSDLLRAVANLGRASVEPAALRPDGLLPGPSAFAPAELPMGKFPALVWGSPTYDKGKAAYVPPLIHLPPGRLVFLKRPIFLMKLS